MRAYCLRRTADLGDADDATSEVFAIAWRRRSDMPGGDRALPWLYGVARRVLSQQRRTAWRHRRLTSKATGWRAPDAPGPEHQVVERQEYAQVREAVGRLRPADREILMLAAWEGLSHRQIAKSLDISPSAVDKRLTRAKRRLAREYDTGRRLSSHRPPASATGGGGSP